MHYRLKSFKELGANAVEYGLVMAIIATLMITAAQVMDKPIQGFFVKSGDCVRGLLNGDSCSGKKSSSIPTRGPTSSKEDSPPETEVAVLGALYRLWKIASNTGKVAKKAKVVIEDKVKKQMTKRGWDEERIKNLLEKPSRMEKVRDTRYRKDGTRRDDSATAYIDKDGHYVIRNDVDGTIVQVSNRNNPNWKPPF